MLPAFPGETPVRGSTRSTPRVVHPISMSLTKLPPTSPRLARSQLFISPPREVVVSNRGPPDSLRLFTFHFSFFPGFPKRARRHIDPGYWSARRVIS